MLLRIIVADTHIRSGTKVTRATFSAQLRLDHVKRRFGFGSIPLLNIRLKCVVNEVGIEQPYLPCYDISTITYPNSNYERGIPSGILRFSYEI